MGDLISRQALDAKNIVHIEMFGRDFPVVAVATLKGLRPVDAVPVVRCRDCKHRQYDSIIGSFWCDGETCGGIEVEADFFCKDGEQHERIL